jgi:two-component system, chemotaxis family, chemotaxis protein CheY
MKILVVDDSKAMRAIVKRALSTLERVAGATIIEAADGRAAFAAVRTEHPDLIMSDWNMPEMTGIELLQALNGAGVAVPFVFVTSGSTPEMRALATIHGAASLVAKPFTPETVDRALAEVL